MLELPGVTLCCIDTLNHALALRALRRSSAGIRFGSTCFISDRPVDEPGMSSIVIAPLASRDAYSEFVLKSLLPHIQTPHVLLVQWDGYAINPDAWRGEYLDVDYIGAKWFWHTDGMRVGNGGFSLRSRKLLEALQDPRIVLTGAEDETIGRAFRPLLEREHGIRFAAESLADAFAFEAAYPVGVPFGFHGLFNFCRVVPPEELVRAGATFHAGNRALAAIGAARSQLPGHGPVACSDRDLSMHPGNIAWRRGRRGRPRHGECPRPLASPWSVATNLAPAAAASATSTATAPRVHRPRQRLHRERQPTSAWLPR